MVEKTAVFDYRLPFKVKKERQMTTIRQENRVKTIGLIIIIFIVAVLLLMIGLLAYVGPEGYFFPYPAIDTQFTAGYSEEGFQQIRPGMTKQEVLNLIGPPINSTTHPHWKYSDDNAFPFWDFAWLVRGVTFDDDGNVTDVTQFVAHD